MQKSVMRSPMSASSPSPETSVTDTSFFINLLPFLPAQPRRDRHILVVDRQVVEQPLAAAQQRQRPPRPDRRAFGAFVAPVRFDAVRPEDGNEHDAVADDAALLVALGVVAHAVALDAKSSPAALLLVGQEVVA